MDPEVIHGLNAYLLALADDELILGHRNSEWCGRAPILEEDIAFANLALDEIAHATLWYSLLADLEGEPRDSYPDQLVYTRPASAFRNLQLVELPNGNWAFSMLRQFFFDARERFLLEGLAKSSYAPLAEIAEKIRREEMYHLRHTQAWVKRLGGGTDTSQRFMQEALESLWPFTRQMFLPLVESELLVQHRLVPDSWEIGQAWMEFVRQVLQESELDLTALPSEALESERSAAHFGDASRSKHTAHLKTLVSELQSVARADPQAEW